MITSTPRQLAEMFYNPAVFPTKEKLIGAIATMNGDTPNQDIVQAVDDVWAEKTQPNKPAPQVHKSNIRTIAERSIARGENRILPIAVGGKNPSITWKNSPLDVASTSEWAGLAQSWIDSLDQQFPELNACVIAKPDEYVFIDNDTAQEFRQGYEKFSGERYPETFTTSATPNHYQEHFRQTDSTRAMGNVVQFSVDEISLSVRQRNLYVLAEGSRHPSGRMYEAIVDADIIPMPDKMVEYIQYLEKKAHQDSTRPSSGNSQDDWKPIDITVEGAPIPHGQHDATLFKIASSLRQRKWDKQEALEHLTKVCEARCVGYGSDYRDMCEKKIASAWKYEVKETGKIEFPVQTTAPAQPQIEQAEIAVIPYPAFPGWVFGGIPAYDKWVKPFCKINSRYPEYMMLPLMTLILNYLSTKKVRIEYKTFPLSIFLLLVGRKGRVIKSSSAQDAMDFCEKMGILAQAGTQTRNAEGKSLVFTVGSTEGLGTEMGRVNCQSAVLFYDEFSKLIAKMSIENSSFANDLSTTYESGKFSNTTKTRKEHFSFNPGSYCLSLIGCTTDKRYPRLASRLFSAVDGMDERFFVLYQPEVLKDVEPMVGVPIPDDVVLATRKAVDQAIEQGVYSIDDSEPLRDISRLNNRLEIRAEKWALAFAVLLGKTSVDESCIERGIALAKYEHAVKKYLAVGESITREGGLQREIRLHVERAGGSMKLRDLQRKVSYDNYGTELWYRVYGGLIRSGILAETGTGKHGDPKMVAVLVPMLRDEED